MKNFTLNNTDDLIDLRGLIERFEEIEDTLDIDASEVMPGTSEELQLMREEHAALESLLDGLKGNGGDEQWRGDWYPVTLIRDSYFTDYAMDLLADTGVLPWDIPHYIVIDEDATARNIRMDYSSVEIDGVTYWYR